MPSKGRIICRVQVLLLACAVVAHPPLPAQAPPAPTVGATLQGWNETMRLTIYDRSGSFSGRGSSRGILQRFNERIDPEYRVDLVSNDFTLAEDYEWHRRGQGARFAAGSVSHVRFWQHAEFVASVPLGTTWGTVVRLTKQETLEAHRNLAQLTLLRELAGGRVRAFASATLNSPKPEIDLDLGIRWMTGTSELTVAVGALDPFSDAVYQGLGVPPRHADSSINYHSHPYTGRIALHVALSERVRLEVYGLAMSPTDLSIVSTTVPDRGFRQDERYAYTGGLFEWAPSTATAVGAVAMWVRARIDREPLVAGDLEDRFDLTEKTWRVGSYAIHRFTDRINVEAWLHHEWRTEDRVFRLPAVSSNVAYEDRAWIGRINATYRARSGFRTDLGLDMVLATAITAQDLPGSPPHRDYRARLDFGWCIGSTALFMMGFNLDLDGGPGFGKGPWDGGHGRFMIYW